MQTFKSFIFIMLFFNSFSALSAICNEGFNPIQNSIFTEKSGICQCILGYTQSADSNFGYKGSGSNAGFSGACNKDADKSVNTWGDTLTIGGLTVAGVAAVGGLAYAGYKIYNCAKPSVTNMNWVGTEGGYKAQIIGRRYNLKGFTKMYDLEEVEGDISSDLAARISALPPEGGTMKYNPFTGDFVSVDKSDRLISRWNSETKSWEPQEGAERWVDNDRIGYRVISTNEDGTNFLNPKTGKIESISKVEETASSTGEAESSSVTSVASNSTNWDEMPDQVDNFTNSDSSAQRLAYGRGRLQTIIEESSSEEEGATFDVEADVEFTNFDSPEPFSPTVTEEFELDPLGGSSADNKEGGYDDATSGSNKDIGGDNEDTGC